MGRRKIEIKAIKDDRNRSVTFLKRKGGLFKKAHELSVLCSVDVAVIIFGHNKKLYEFSSGDINEIIGRYQYYGNAHEHKGPGDFNGGKDGDDDDDEEMGSPPPGSHSSQDPPLIPHNLQDNPNYQHMRHHTPSASPPIANGLPYHPRHGTPPLAPQNLSRPSSRNTGRRTSSNLIPQPPHPQQYPPPHPQAHPQAHHLPHTSQSQGPPSHNGMAYMPNPAMGYNPQAGAPMPMPTDSSQAGPYHPYPAQAGPPPPPPVYMPEQPRRTSVPPSFSQDRAPPVEDTAAPPPAPNQGLMPEPKRSVKARSIWTPVDDTSSFLAKHWGTRTSASEAPPEPPINDEASAAGKASEGAAHRAQSVEVASVSRNTSNPAGSSGPASRSGRHANHTRGNTSMSSLPEIPPPQRTNSVQWGSAQGGKRPQLKVQIPDEPSDGGGSADATSSPRGSSGTAGGGGPSAKGASTEASHSSGVVLPPPSPSASALLSAGAQGPPNPFARPNPPSSAAPSNSIETPISALPSRFMAEGLLPSPSSFYPEWNFGRGGGESNLLPSPLNFQTPVMPNGPSFSRDDPESTTKRKSPEGEGSDNGATKRMKT